MGGALTVLYGIHTCIHPIKLVYMYMYTLKSLKIPAAQDSKVDV